MLNPSNTIVIADFDGTLIKKNVNGKRITSFASILQHNPAYLTEKGVKEIHQLAEQYYPIELDPTISLSQKSTYMQEWWEKCYEAYKRYHVTQQMIAETCNSPFIQLRSGLISFLHFLATQNILCIIYSASGVGIDGIKLLLEKYDVVTPNIRMCSNDLLFDKDGVFIDIKPPIIHSANKTGYTLIKNGIIQQTPKQRQCLLIGDGLEDIRMSEGLNFDMVYKVAFGDVDSEEFKKRFDVVLPTDAGYDPVRALFQK